MKKSLILLVALTILLTGCSSDRKFNANLAAFHKENINIDQEDLTIGPITLTKNNDCYIVIVNILLESDEIFESVLINQTLTSIFEDYKVVFSFGANNVEMFDESSIWKNLSLRKYIVNHTLTYVINENDISVDKRHEFDKVVSGEKTFSNFVLSFYGVKEELFYSLDTYVELEK